MSDDRLDFIDEQLAARAAAGLRRELRLVEPGATPWIERAGKRLLHLCSNNYLGLATHPEVIAAAREALETHGAGAGASRLISGNLAVHEDLEHALARLKKQEAALVFPTGYAANLGAITALAGPRDLILADALNHASLNDGCRLSGARVRHYRHADVDHLRELLALEPPRGRVLIVTDGVFSMDGDVAPLPQLADAADKANAVLIVDDAHGTGVLGSNGSGSAEATHTVGRVHVHIGTLSKALGSQGGFVAGSRKLIDWLLNAARTHVFSTGLAPACAAAATAAIRLVQAEPHRRERVRELAQRMRDGLTAAGFTLRPLGSTATLTPLIAVHVGDASAAVALASALEARGVLAPAVRPPTVPDGTSRLRVTLMADHSDDDVALALRAFGEAGRETGVLP